MSIEFVGPRLGGNETETGSSDSRQAKNYTEIHNEAHDLGETIVVEAEDLLPPMQVVPKKVPSPIIPIDINVKISHPNSTDALSIAKYRSLKKAA